MTETVTDIIVSRSRSQDGLKTMIVWSLGLHAAMLVGLLFAPAPASEAPPVVMTISLSGDNGVRTEGMTQAGAQPVKQPEPPIEEKKPVVTAPPKEQPEMTIADPKARTRLEKPKPQPPTEAPSTPVTAPAPTKVRGQGFGLSQTGGRGLGGVQVDEDFCCTEYLLQMKDLIQAKWNDKQGVPGANVMKFTIRRDGTIVQVQLERPSGLRILDDESQHALLATAKLPPLPQQYLNATLTVHLRFDYQ